MIWWICGLKLVPWWIKMDQHRWMACVYFGSGYVHSFGHRTLVEASCVFRVVTTVGTPCVIAKCLPCINVCTACYNFHILHVFCYVLFSKFNARPVPWHVDSDDSHISAAMDGSLDVRGVGGFLLSDRRCLCDLTQHVSTWSWKVADCLGVSAWNQ